MSDTHYFVPYEDGDVKRANGTIRKKQFRIVWYCERCAHDIVVERRPKGRGDVEAFCSRACLVASVTNRDAGKLPDGTPVSRREENAPRSVVDSSGGPA